MSGTVVGIGPQPRQPRARGWRASALPVPGLVALLAVVHAGVDPSGFYDPPWLILLGNCAFIAGVGLVVALIAARSYRATGRIQVLLLGCGVLVFGVGAALAAVVRSLPEGANLNVAVYNVGALFAAVLHALAAFMVLAGGSTEVSSRRRRSLLLVGYAGAAAVMIAVTASGIRGWLPPFFVQGLGPTALRQEVLGTADVLFVFSFVAIAGTYLRTRDELLYWYAGALALTAISLTAFFVQRSVGSPIGWVGRFSQYLGGAYFLVGLLGSVRAAHSRGTSLDNVVTAALSGAEEMFRALAENTPDVIRRFDRGLRHIYVNAAARRLYGRPAGAIVGKTMPQLGVGDEPSRLWSERIERVFATGERLQVEEYLQGREGEGFFQSQCVPEYGHDGAVANVLVVSRDLTERKRAEEAVSRSEEQYRSLFNSMDEGFAMHEIITDAGGHPIDYRFLAVNPAFERLTGLARDEVLGKTLREVLPGEDPRWVEEYGRVALAGESVRFENYAPVLKRHYEVYAFRSAPRQFAVVFRDITAHKAAERALAQAKSAAEEANRQKDHFLAVLSHELRNPLTPIRNSIYILERVAAGGEQARRAQSVIDRQVRQLARLVDDLLDVTRISRNRIQLHRERLDLNDVVRRATDDQRTLFDDARVRLEMQPSPEPVVVDADPQRVAQIVGNLLQNAAKFTLPGGLAQVSVEVDTTGTRAVIRVRDTGVGMAPEMLPRLFQPFMQADATLDRSKGGLGLGLALVKGLVELHGGEVSAHSEGLGWGSELVVRLPLAPEGTAVARAQPEAGQSGRRRVLVIEDNVDAAESLREVLELRGHEVALAHDGKAGVAKALEDRPDVVLCDLGLPGMDGYEVARALRREPRLERTLLVALSGYAMPSDLQKATEAGFEQHLAKPPTIEALEAVLAWAGGGKREGEGPTTAKPDCTV